MSLPRRATIAIAVGFLFGLLTYVMPPFAVRCLVSCAITWAVLDLIDWMSNAPYDPTEPHHD